MKQIGNIYFIAAIAVIGKLFILFSLGPTMWPPLLFRANPSLQAVAFSALISLQ
jgi:hypothetical protein